MPITTQGVEVKPKPLEGLPIEELEKLERYYDAEGHRWDYEFYLLWYQHGSIRNWETYKGDWTWRNRTQWKLRNLARKRDEWWALKNVVAAEIKKRRASETTAIVEEQGNDVG
jgi:hypothetical protein